MSCYMKLMFVYVLFILGFVKSNNDDLRRIDAIYPESPCTAAGGTCTIATDCPDGGLSEQRGLCPKQKSQGIECCYGISIKETRCTKHGGECMSLSKGHCNPRLVFNGAQDCPGDTRCCILV